jgi:TetR/AcrR family transcriptional repressor of nem operon
MATLVHRQGYMAVGVDQVCKTAGVKKGSFYHFFKSKRDLMIAALNQQWNEGRERFIHPAFDLAEPPLKRIERLLTTMAVVETANKAREGCVLGCPFGNLAAEVGTSEPVLMKRANEALAGLRGYIRDALTDAQRAGDLAPTVDVQAAADAILAYFEGLSLLAKARNDPTLIRRLGPRAVQLAVGPAAVADPSTARVRQKK